MNKIAQEIFSYFGISNNLTNEFFHYGMPRRSGRYPWGSGENPYQHEKDFLVKINELKSEGLTESEIAKRFNLTTTQLRIQKSLATNQYRADQVATAKGLKEKGYSNTEIAEKMGLKGESSVRSLLNEKAEVRMNQAQATADFLEKQIDEKGMIDVGAGVEKELGISDTKLQEALYILELDGYEVYGGRMNQVTNPGKKTTIKVACPPGTEHKEIYDTSKINSITDYISYDGGESYKPSFAYPSSMDSSRLKIRYAEEGGKDKDGLIEIRRGVDDLSLGESHYAQVRILVDGDRYLKGMAVYSDDLPDGVDVLFNTNKKAGTDVRDVLKKISEDPDNPFGSLIKEKGGQSYYTDSDGNEQLSLINKRADEGDWGDWSKELPSQFLSKQSMQLINKQLDLTVANKQAEYDEICALTNPTVKKKLLMSFADDCDSAAVHLQAASLPRQKYQVILPLTTVGDNEVYAPNYNDGETVALVRFPHGGTFEIPILKVNNKNSEGQSVIGNDSSDAIGINSNVAARLSGADFDGDTVLVIPCNSSSSKVYITSTPPLEGLVGFDPKESYGTVEKDGKYYNSNGQEIKVMADTQKQMGVISNLITDMTLKGADDDEKARAVRHSMVVIDAEKHKLDYKTSYEENGIAALKEKYQSQTDPNTGKTHEGASTLISKAKSQQSVLKRVGSPQIDKDTGEVSYKEVTETYTDKNGKIKVRTQVSTKMAETKDAYTLSSGTQQENAYASYANSMKAMANSARKEALSTKDIKYNSSAKAVYSTEVDSINSKLNLALKNAPRERQAQAMANAIIKAKKDENPGMTKSEITKAATIELKKAREAVGAQRNQITLTDKEWEAIQAGAVSPNVLTKVLNNCDLDQIKELATPRKSSSKGLSDAKIAQIKALAAAGYTISEIAEKFGISTSSVQYYLKS